MFFEFAVFSQQQKPWSQSLIVHKSHLVGGIPTPLKNMSSSNGIIIPSTWESHKIPWFQTTKQFFSIATKTCQKTIQDELFPISPGDEASRWRVDLMCQTQ
jgi:hypothetical protein